jgi:hypothetical protein
VGTNKAANESQDGKIFEFGLMSREPRDADPNGGVVNAEPRFLSPDRETMASAWSETLHPKLGGAAIDYP